MPKYGPGLEGDLGTLGGDVQLMWLGSTYASLSRKIERGRAWLKMKLQVEIFRDIW